MPRAGGSSRRLSGLRVHVAALPAGHVRPVGPLAVTSAARTVVDLARRLPYSAALVAADGALHRGLVRPAELGEVAGQLCLLAGHPPSRPGRPIRRRAGRVPAGDLVPGPVRPARPAGADLQAVVADRRDGWHARVDFLWPESATVVEADGRLKYGEPGDLWQEKLRQERIEELGYVVRRVTWAQVTRQPDATIARVRRALHRQR